MALSIAVHPLTPTLDMYGDSDPSAAYSLSGHVSISVSSSTHSLFNHHSTVRLLLQSLSLTFEGQSDVYSPCIGYSSLRLCSITRELAPSKPTELSNEDSGETCIWNVIFNLPIPGWLPPTTSHGIEDTGIRYLLYATAKFTYLDQDQMSWSFTSLCTPFRSQAKSAHGQTEIQLRRFISAPRVDTIDPEVVNYLVDSHDLTSASVSNKPRVPVEVLNKIQLLVSVPEYTNVKGSTLPLTLRLRTKDLREEDCKRLQVTEVAVDILQREKCRSRPPLKRLRQYPLPLNEMQPPNLPLLDPHPLSFIYDAGFFGRSAESVCRTFSMLPSSSSGTYKLPENNYVFVNDATPEEVATWYTMETVVPFVQCRPADADLECPEWPGSPDLLPSLSSPLYSVRHNASITLTCAFDLPSGEVAYDQITFTVPITFANVAPILPSVRTWTPPPAHSPDFADAAALSTSATPPSSLPHLSHFSSNMSPDPIPVLPAYSQLYDFYGEPKIDYSTPLPLYSPRSSAEALVKGSSSTSSISPSSDSHLDLTSVYHDRDYTVKVPV